MFRSIIKISVLVLTLSGAVQAQAAATKFSCANVNGVDEWTIYVDLEKGLAGFFDNDTTSVIPLKTTRLLESNPPQMQYTFEGKDSSGRNGDRFRIVFNKTRMTASITTSLGQAASETMSSEDGCRVDNDVTLDNE